MTEPRWPWWRAAVALTVSGMAVFVSADTAGAEVSEGCEATLAGEDVGSRSSTDVDDAIEVGAKDVVQVSGTSDAPIDGYTVEMEFAGISWEVASGDTDGTTWSDEVDVADYARYGVGLYKVRAVVTGEGACEGAVLVEITGKSPLTTAAGIGALVVGAGGLALAASAIASAGKVPAGAGR